ncbi:uncharacterized protein [Aegilops tauschii subsp. strangulata]|uniref:uncharacterized protein isoform X1 n=1 Tax=Aegilops tauschii subsp. strangulata TaxID=200361 RepID=UPI001ABD1247|nr:uncharacterized protein LOC109734078 isoform X2 [Aegilops tauschii subsp. strangulata]XP_044440457.1 uncharacterized protein LOC123166732 isoform X2 [Triticum aestivum]
MAMAMTSLQDVLQQIFEYNGSPVVEMVGKNCFAIASDYHLGVQLQTIATDFQRAFKIHGKLYISLSGLTTDAQTLASCSGTTWSGRTSRTRSLRTWRRSATTSSSSAWLAPLADPSLASTNLLLSLASSISRCCVFWKMEEEENLFLLN